MKRAELQYNHVIDPHNPALNTSSLDVQKTLEHFAEVINEMQEEIYDRVKYDEYHHQD